MKTYKNLFAQVTAFETLYQAYQLARRGKRDRVAVADFEFNKETRIICLLVNAITPYKLVFGVCLH